MGNMSFPDLPQAKLAGALRHPPDRRRFYWGIAALLAALIGAYLFWGGKREARTPPPAPVVVATAQKRPVTVHENTIGTVVATATVRVTSRVEGQLLSAAFKEGDFVRKGDLLFQLDPRPFQALLNQATAARNRDQAQARAARHDATRYAALVAQGAVSRSLADQYAANAAALEASVAADQAQVEAARLNLTYAEIRSPVDGKTGAITIQPGNIVPANSATPLVIITQTQPIKVSFALPQAELPRIQDQWQKGTLIASVKVHDAGEKEIHAPVTFVGNAVDDRTGTIELRVDYDNKDELLVPGQLVDVKVALKNIPEAVVVPSDAVNTGPNQRYVYVVSAENVAQMREVTVIYDDGVSAAIEGKVKAGDKVVTQGQLRLVPNAKVTLGKPAS